eukprot:m.97107 g.97107  ORF g.97107 m.97107 type:complete len:252 (-) comp13579_c0_seq1:208-963(-)
MPQKRCFVGCGRWEFANGMCKECKGLPGAAKMQRVGANLAAYKNQAPLAVLVATGSSTVATHVKLQEGHYVDVLEDVDATGEILVRTHNQNVEKRIVGYFPRDKLLTEDEIYAQFMAEEDERLQKEIDKQKREKAAEEAAYEEELRQKMKLKAEQDRKQRAIDAENRRLEAERLQRELAEREAREAEQRRILEEQRRKDMEERAKKLAAEEKARIEEARRNKQEWEDQQNRAREQEMLRLFVSICRLECML